MNVSQMRVAIEEAIMDRIAGGKRPCVVLVAHSDLNRLVDGGTWSPPYVTVRSDVRIPPGHYSVVVSSPYADTSWREPK